MKVPTRRNVMRWLHVLASVPIAGYIYGLVARIPPAAFAVKWVIVPIVTLSGLWLWKGDLVKNVFPSKPLNLKSQRIQFLCQPIKDL